MGARILIIEDNPANLELMTYLLGAFGHTVQVAGNGHEGLAAARDRPELIVCDVQLPDIDGLEIARRLRADPVLRQIPLVAVTALAMVGDRNRIVSAGFDGYLTKPIDPEMFVSQIDAFLPDRLHSAPRRESEFQTAPDEELRPGTFTVLVVDNLSVNLELARGILAPSGYNVVTAGGMAEGLALAREIVCHLILSDVCMGGSTGFEFLRAVRADARLRSIPFVLITSTKMTEADKVKGLALGATRYLRRPIEPETLLAEIDACVTQIQTERKTR